MTNYEPLDLRHQEASSGVHIGQMYYYLHLSPDGKASHSLRVNELNTGVNFTHEGRYSVQEWLRDGWTMLVTDVESDSPEGAANIALDVIGALR